MPWAKPEDMEAAKERLTALESRMGGVENDIRRLAEVCRKIVESFKKSQR